MTVKEFLLMFTTPAGLVIRDKGISVPHGIKLPNLTKAEPSEKTPGGPSPMPVTIYSQINPGSNGLSEKEKGPRVKKDDSVVRPPSNSSASKKLRRVDRMEDFRRIQVEEERTREAATAAITTNQAAKAHQRATNLGHLALFSLQAGLILVAAGAVSGAVLKREKSGVAELEGDCLDSATLGRSTNSTPCLLVALDRQDISVKPVAYFLGVACGLPLS